MFFHKGVPVVLPEHLQLDLAVGSVRWVLYGEDIVKQDDELLVEIMSAEDDSEDPRLREIGGRRLHSLHVLLQLVVEDGALLFESRHGVIRPAKASLGIDALTLLRVHQVGPWLGDSRNHELPSGGAIADAGQIVYAALEQGDNDARAIPAVGRDRLWARLARLGVPLGRMPSEEWLKLHDLELPHWLEDEGEPDHSTADTPGSLDLSALGGLDDILVRQAWVRPKTVARLWDVETGTVNTWASKGDPRMPNPVLQQHRRGTWYQLLEVLEMRERWRRKHGKKPGGRGDGSGGGGGGDG